MPDSLEFICGCRTGIVVARQNIKTMSSVRYDDEGFLICAIHEQRRKGWRSTPNFTSQRGKHILWEFASYTPLEIEGFVVFGEPLPVKVANILDYDVQVSKNS